MLASLCAAASAACYATVGSAWLATARPRALLVRRSSSFLVTAGHAAAQLFAALVLAAALYGFLYAYLMPEAVVSHDVHLGLCQPARRRGVGDEDAHVRVGHLAFGTPPPAGDGSGGTSLSRPGALSVVPPLSIGQAYSVSLCLRMPDSPSNLEVGTFSAALRLSTRDNVTVHTSSRPLLLRYRSASLRWVWVHVLAVPLLFGWVDEAQTLCEELAPSFVERRLESASLLTLVLASPRACSLQVYSSTITFTARMHGLTYLMHAYFLSSAALGIAALAALHLLALLAYELRVYALVSADAGPVAAPSSGQPPPPRPHPAVAADVAAAGAAAEPCGGRESAGPYADPYAAAVMDEAAHWRSRSQLGAEADGGSEAEPEGAGGGLRRRVAAGAAAEAVPEPPPSPHGSD